MSVKVAHVTVIPESLKVLLLDQLRTIGDAGYEVTGVSAAGPATAALETRGIRHVAVPFVRSTGLTPGADARVVAHLVRLFRRERFTIVHTHTAKPDLFASIAARIAGVPIVMSTLHGFYFSDDMPARKRRFWLELAKLGMRACDAVLSQSPEDVDTAIREHICPASKISTLGNGIDLTAFDPERIDRGRIAALRKELGIADGAPVIGFVGRMVREKGVIELFEAARAIREQFPTVRIVMIGMFDTAKADAISAATAAEYGLADTCIFTGHRDDMPELYALMDLFVLPSHREGFPRSPMEASAMGVPVVATNIRGCRTAVDDGKTGLLVPLGDVPALTAAMTRLLGDAGLRERMGRAGRRVARERFDQRLVFQTVLATYDRLLRARGLVPPAVH